MHTRAPGVVCVWVVGDPPPRPCVRWLLHPRGRFWSTLCARTLWGALVLHHGCYCASTHADGWACVAGGDKRGSVACVMVLWMEACGVRGACCVRVTWDAAACVGSHNARTCVVHVSQGAAGLLVGCAARGLRVRVRCAVACVEWVACCAAVGGAW